jgi:hypothetical protein
VARRDSIFIRNSDVKRNFLGKPLKSGYSGILVGYHDGKVRAEKGTQAALLALFHLLALGREVTPGIHLLGRFQHLGRAELDADSATLAVFFLYEKLWHNLPAWIGFGKFQNWNTGIMECWVIQQL